MEEYTFQAALSGGRQGKCCPMKAMGFRRLSHAGEARVVAIDDEGRDHLVGLTVAGLLAGTADEAYARLDAACDVPPLDCEHKALAPIDDQEVWGSGVNYRVSRAARIEESKTAADVYEQVYDAIRPELFFKAPAQRVPAPGAPLRIRGDSQWNVPEPELGVVFTATGERVGYVVGNDQTSRGIERENPLYLPQAKIYDDAVSLSDTVVLARGIDASRLLITMEITRDGSRVFYGETSTEEMRRGFDELRQYLFDEISFQSGVVLLTGTGIVPPEEFTLLDGDAVRIEIAEVGVLQHTVYESSRREVKERG